MQLPVQNQIPCAGSFGCQRIHVALNKHDDNYHGHEYMDLERFAEDTRHMIIFDVLTDDSPMGWKGERTRLFLTEAGYQKSLENQEKGHIKILSHAKVRQGHLYYDRSDQLR